MNALQINSAIKFGSWTEPELYSMIESIKFARANLQKQVKRALSIGDSVNFFNSKQGRNMTGLVVKIAQKYVTVRTVDALWRVPAELLTRVAEEHEVA